MGNEEGLKDSASVGAWREKSEPRAVSEAGCEHLRFVSRAVVELASVLGRGVGWESRSQLLWTEETYLSPTLTPRLYLPCHPLPQY